MASERRRRQVARQIQERVAEILLFEMKDPRLTFVTITGVELNADLTMARVRYTVLDPAHRGKVAHMLEHAHGFLRTEVARAVELRSAPQVVFEYDLGVEQAARIDAILDRVLPPEERIEGPELPEPPEDGA
jgi:ribosome-binding factor A